MLKKPILAMLFFLTTNTVLAQSCMPSTGTTTSGTSDNLSNIKIGRMFPGSDGFIHATYGFGATVDQNTQDLFANAAQQWNGVTATTGVIFEQAAPGQTPDISMAPIFDQSGGCIAISAQEGSVAFNLGWQELEASNPTTATASIAQELGHFLGMADAGPNPSQPTIMNNPFTGFCADAQVHTTSVQPADAQLALGCTSQARVEQNPPQGPFPGRPCLVDGNNCDPCDPDCTPIILDTEGEGFHLTSAEAGVLFDISGSGQPVHIAWTDPDFHNAFLALPGPDGLIHNGKELFGNFTPQPPSAHPNGFIALAQYDKPENGGNGDGIIDDHDEVFARLRLWIDENHDGVCQPNELHRLPELGVYSLTLNYQESRRTDQFGNQFRYKARVNSGDRRDSRDERPHGEPNEVGRWTYDVFFVIK